MKDVIIIGGGSSIKEGIEKGLYEKIKGKEIWSINFAYKTLPYLPQREIWLDTKFFKNNGDDLMALTAQGVRLDARLHRKYFELPINSHKTTRTPAVAEDPKENKVFIGQPGLSGFLALSLAVKEKFDNIYLLGYDFGTPGGRADIQTHYYQDQVQDLKIISSGVGNPSVYLSKRSDKIRPGVMDFEWYLKFPSKIWNVSLQSNIHCFDRIGYDEFFTKLN